MGKDSPSTTGLQVSANQLGELAQMDKGLARQYLDMANEMYSYGKGQYQKYTTPVLDEYLKIVGLSPTTGSTVTPPPGQDTMGANQLSTTASTPFMNPMASNLFQLPTMVAGQQSAQAKKGIMNQDALGPAMKSILSGNVDIQKMQGLQSNAYQLVQGMLGTLTGAGQTAYSQGQSGYGMAGGLSATMMGQAGSTTSAAGSLQGQIAALQQQAQQSSNAMLGSVFNTIGTIGGLGLGLATTPMQGTMMGGWLGY